MKMKEYVTEMGEENPRGAVEKQHTYDHENKIVATQYFWSIGGHGFEKRVWGPEEGGLTCYYRDRKLHRLTGPAVYRGDEEEYYVNGEKVTENEFNFFYRKRPKPR